MSIHPPQAERVPYSCPLIDNVREILYTYQQELGDDYEKIVKNLEEIREINRKLREKLLEGS